MIPLRELLLDLLFNALVQITLFATLAATLSTFIVKAKAKHQHLLYLSVFALCLAAPSVNTLWLTRSNGVTQMQPIQKAEPPGHRFWNWIEHSQAHQSKIPMPGIKSAILVIWLALFLYHLMQFSRGLNRVHRLRRDARILPPSPLALAGLSAAQAKVKPPHPILLLKSTSIDDPITVGVIHPAIILPSKLIEALGEPDLTAILAHEYAHIHRKDFLTHVLCQLLALPVAWHPGIRYLMSRISHTRELACDEYAASSLGARIPYARTLLRLATLCLEVPRSNAMGLGMFNHDNLEDRIMTLTQKKTSLSRAGLLSLAFTTTALFGSGAMLARAVSLQEAPATSNNTQKFAGTWHWMFHGQSFATMTLVQNGSQISGSTTESRIALNDNGELSKADPSDNKTPSQITRTKLEGDALRVSVQDGFEFIVTLKDATHAEIHPVGAPANMKPIQAERIR